MPVRFRLFNSGPTRVQLASTILSDNRSFYLCLRRDGCPEPANTIPLFLFDNRFPSLQGRHGDLQSCSPFVIKSFSSFRHDGLPLNTISLFPFDTRFHLFQDYARGLPSVSPSVSESFPPFRREGLLFGLYLAVPVRPPISIPSKAKAAHGPTKSLPFRREQLLPFSLRGSPQAAEHHLAISLWRLSFHPNYLQASPRLSKVFDHRQRLPPPVKQPLLGTPPPPHSLPHTLFNIHSLPLPQPLPLPNKHSSSHTLPQTPRHTLFHITSSTHALPRSSLLNTRYHTHSSIRPLLPRLEPRP